MNRNSRYSFTRRTIRHCDRPTPALLPALPGLKDGWPHHWGLLSAPAFPAWQNYGAEGGKDPGILTSIVGFVACLVSIVEDLFVPLVETVFRYYVLLCHFSGRSPWNTNDAIPVMQHPRSLKNCSGINFFGNHPVLLCIPHSLNQPKYTGKNSIISNREVLSSPCPGSLYI